MSEGWARSALFQMLIGQRADRDGHPVELGDAWVVRNGAKDRTVRPRFASVRLRVALDDHGPVALASVPLV
jgi:hypothetical protein